MAVDKDTFKAWLRDAHAAEQGTIDNIERLVERMGDYPEFVARYRLHLQESRRHAEQLENVLRRLEVQPSTMKDLMTRAAGVIQSFGARAAPDEPVKQCIAAQAYESFQASSYGSLAAAAETFAEPEVKAMCEEFRGEEQAMAKWLEDHIPQITQQYLRG